ncbi:hypothetical protein HOI26_02045 [Candidatus Woesearchaeota archaeon]|jgi:hypothetical protein|nr:hypothetical protein [Candidatus Woesearchaeota archaeon]MBT5739859.1 hypothetical protein [Candidatus Woesearchaeota archaeon]
MFIVNSPSKSAEWYPDSIPEFLDRLKKTPAETVQVELIEDEANKILPGLESIIYAPINLSLTAKDNNNNEILYRPPEEFTLIPYARDNLVTPLMDLVRDTLNPVHPYQRLNDAATPIAMFCASHGYKTILELKLRNHSPISNVTHFSPNNHTTSNLKIPSERIIL